MDMEKFLDQIVSKMLFHYSQNNLGGVYYYFQVAFEAITEKMLSDIPYSKTKPWSQSEVWNLDEMIRFTNDVSNGFKYLSSGIESIEDCHGRFLLGKKATKNITMDNGIVIVEVGEVITEKILNNAKLANKLTELAMNAQ